MKIKRGDQVEVISGRDKGAQGEVIRVLPKNLAVVIQGVNVRKKHQRQIQAGGRTMSPGVIQFEAPIHVSNIMLVCPKCKELTRVGMRRGENSIQRICKKCQAVVDG
ncbi:MAG: 50S ribosomal protein L24 [Anaerolineales bacterium]|nr:MAG: 50S ribosomal protein L24 [Anaerolineales bacterium]